MILFLHINEDDFCRIQLYASSFLKDPARSDLRSFFNQGPIYDLKSRLLLTKFLNFRIWHCLQIFSRFREIRTYPCKSFKSMSYFLFQLFHYTILGWPAHTHISPEFCTYIPQPFRLVTKLLVCLTFIYYLLYCN